MPLVEKEQSNLKRLQNLRKIGLNFTQNNMQ